MPPKRPSAAPSLRGNNVIQSEEMWTPPIFGWQYRMTFNSALGSPEAVVNIGPYRLSLACFETSSGHVWWYAALHRFTQVQACVAGTPDESDFTRQVEATIHQVEREVRALSRRLGCGGG